MESAKSGIKIKKSYVYATLIVIAVVAIAILVGRWLWVVKPAEFTNKPLNIKTREVGESPKFYFSIYGTGKEELQKPMDVYSNGKSVFVTDASLAKVLVFDESNGEFLFSFGRSGKKDGQFTFPYGITADKSGKIYVADLTNDNISIFTSEGIFEGYFTPVSEEDKIESPSAIRIADDKLYVPEIETSKVKVFDLKGNKLFEISAPEGSEDLLDSPNGIAIDKNGNIYLSDSGNSRVVKYDNKGNLDKTFNGSGEFTHPSLDNPRGIIVDVDGTIFILDMVAQHILHVSPEGELVATIGEKGTENSQFLIPNGMYMSENRNIYVTDRLNQRIQLFK